MSSCIVGRFWVRHGFFNRLIRGHTGNWVIVVSSCIVGRFSVRHDFFDRLIRVHRCVQLHCGKVLGSPSPLFYRLRGCTGNWPLLCRVELWEAFGYAMVSLTG